MAKRQLPEFWSSQASNWSGIWPSKSPPNNDFRRFRRLPISSPPAQPSLWKTLDNTTYLRDGTLLFSPGSIPGAAGTFSMDGLLLGALDTRCIGEMKRIQVSVVRGMRREGGKLNLRLCQHPSHVNEIQTSSLRRQGFKNSIGKSFSNRYTSRL